MMQETHVGKKAVYFNVNEELKKRLKMTLETTVGGGSTGPGGGREMHGQYIDN